MFKLFQMASHNFPSDTFFLIPHHLLVQTQIFINYSIYMMCYILSNVILIILLLQIKINNFLLMMNIIFEIKYTKKAFINEIKRLK